MVEPYIILEALQKAPFSLNKNSVSVWTKCQNVEKKDLFRFTHNNVDVASVRSESELILLAAWYNQIGLR